MKRGRGLRVGLAVGTFPRPGGGRCPVLIPSPPVFHMCGGGGRLGPPNGYLCPVPWVKTPIGDGYKASGRLALPAQQPARRR